MKISRKYKKDIFNSQQTRKHWKFIWLIAIFLFILITFLNHTRLYNQEPNYSFGDCFECIIDSNFMYLFYLSIAFLISLLLFLNFKFIVKRHWKFNRILALTFIIATVFSSIQVIEYMYDNRKQFNYCIEIPLSERMIYETSEAKIYFNKSDLIKRIDKEMNFYSFDTTSFKLYSDLKFFIENKAKNYNRLEDFELSVVLDYFLKSESNQDKHSGTALKEKEMIDYFFKERINEIVMDILAKDNIKIYNKITGRTESYIYYRRWRDFYGSFGIIFYFPSGNIFIDHQQGYGL